VRRSALILISAVASSAALSLGCTQDFNQFEPVPGATGGGGMGGATSSSSSMMGSGGQGGATTSTSSSSSGTGGGATGEDCLNGVDDDNDGDVDCADTECSVGYTCATAPGGWNGPVALFEGASAQDPGCSGDFPGDEYMGHQGLVPEPAMCSQCTCAAPNVNCVLSPIAFGDATCGAAYNIEFPANAGQCMGISVPAMTMGASADAPMAFPSGACTASNVTVTRPPPSWQNVGRTCSAVAEGKGCPSSGASCVPKPQAPFASGLCVYRSGNLPCPAGFSQKHVFDDGVNDNRDCSPCQCGSPSATCTATTSIYNGANCGGSPNATVPNDGSCAAVSGGGSMKATVSSTVSCPASGGQPTGSISAGFKKTTVCCAM